MNVWDCALGFMDSQILLTAEELGVFDRLDAGAAGVSEVAAATGLPEDSVGRLLVALCALGLIYKTPDERFYNGPEASAQLVRGKPGYIGHMFRHVREDLYPIWHHLKHALIEGKPQWHLAFPDRPEPGDKVYSDPQALRSFMRGMHAITYAAARQFAASAAAELRGIGRIVDVGGASGAFGIALAQANPSLHVTVFDLPQVRPIAEEFIRDSGVDGRVEFHAGDFWQDNLPGGADAYSLGFILHDWDDMGQSILLNKAAAACPPGGMLIIGEYLLNDEKTGPLFVARADLNMLMAARSGRERSASEYRDWIAQFGFELGSVYATAGGKHFMLARHLPGSAHTDTASLAAAQENG